MVTSGALLSAQQPYDNHAFVASVVTSRFDGTGVHLIGGCRMAPLNWREVDWRFVNVRPASGGSGVTLQ